jgi:hypothetical protein
VISINGKLVDNKENKFISHTVIRSFEEKSDIEEDSKNSFGETCKDDRTYY